MAPLPFVVDLGGGVFAVDTGFHRDRFDAAYLLVQDGRAAFVDTGTQIGAPRLMAALAALGLAPAAVDYVIPTHVHLDHAGGAGWLMQQCPQATLLVHARGARHLIDPKALWMGATAVYGAEEMTRSYGGIVPVPAERVCATEEGMEVSLAGRRLRFADTPGHARHHHCVWDEVTRGWFTGDTFGLSYREFDTGRGPWIVPTTTPVQFEPDELRLSVERLMAAQPDCLYLTHFGRVTGVSRLGAQFLALLDEMVALGRTIHRQAGTATARHEALKAGLLGIFADSLAAHGCTLGRAEVAELLAIDIELDAQGMAIWLDRR
ncbi:MBL fold metallo-hydrolase [Rubrivivax sp. A210]|uniref:MBL fold metallo-hydrolase n=1 Tax=Rubrivivax sp. A210 TaxID=2772301 RepID=UPI001918F3DD|nr:MBL fold metallo-hydrolase [Rubrivivax sp. A210]CAD5374620.1 MBL fold metallo-hydrolase [Rubrivivax sp. A210]